LLIDKDECEDDVDLPELELDDGDDDGFYVDNRSAVGEFTDEDREELDDMAISHESMEEEVIPAWKEGNSPRKKDFSADVLSNVQEDILSALKLAVDLNLLEDNVEDKENLLLFSERVFSSFGEQYGVKQAQEASKDFSWNLEELSRRNVDTLKESSYDLPAVARSILHSRADTHLNARRVEMMRIFRYHGRI